MQLSFKLDNTSSKIILGGISSKYYTGKMNYHPVILQAWWTIGADSCGFIGKQTHNFPSGERIIVDSGTPTMAIDYNVF